MWEGQGSKMELAVVSKRKVRNRGKNNYQVDQQTLKAKIEVKLKRILLLILKIYRTKVFYNA